LPGFYCQRESAIGKRAKRAIIASHRTRRLARLARIAFGFAQARLSLRTERLLRMTTKSCSLIRVSLSTKIGGRRQLL
jgi:hypothetical protein